MSIMEDSFSLLSSMSPKVDNTKKITARKVTKLALKKYVRKSLVYDKKSGCVNTTAYVLSSTSEEISSGDDALRKRDQHGSDNSVIIIRSSSDEECASSSDTGSYKTASSVIPESERDDDKIKKDSDFPTEWNCLPKFNDFLRQFKKVSQSKKNDDGSNCCNEQVQNNVESTDVQCNKDVVEKDIEALNNSLNNLNIDHIQEDYPSPPVLLDDEEKLLDNLYGSTWRELQNKPTGNPKTEKKKPTQQISHLNTSKCRTEIKKKKKVRNIRTNNLWDSDSSDSDADNEKFDKISNKLSFEDSDGDCIQSRKTEKEQVELEAKKEVKAVRKKKSSETKHTHYPSTPNFRTDDERILDEVYGPMWRELEESPLPKSEKKKPTNQFIFPSMDKPKTETKRKPSLTYKNPYLDSEKEKSNSLLKTLHAARFRLNLESPWMQRIQNLCDGESSSDKENKKFGEVGKKLSFEDSDDDADSDNINSKKKVMERNKKFSKPKYEDSSTTSSSTDSDEYLKTKPFRKIPIVQEASFLASLSLSIPIVNCDPAARIYRENFKVQKENLVSKLFIMYNENVFDGKLPENMLIEWNNRMRGTAGYCYNRKITRRTGVIERNARIALSTKVVDSADRLRDTLIHEMCHAAAWIINETTDGHGPLWRAWASKAVKIYPDLPPIKRCHNFAITTKYTYKCTSCGYSFGRHSKSLDMERKRCGYCFGKFEVLINKTTKDGPKSVPATPRKASAFADFVKENYKSVKTNSLKHGDVMKILGKQFKDMKIQKQNECT